MNGPPVEFAPALERAREIADAVLYEGYLLYPYRASSSKNQMRWQFGILGPVGAADGIGEPPQLTAEFLLAGGAAGDDHAGTADQEQLSGYLRFLQLQVRQLLDADGEPVRELHAGSLSWLSWEEAVPRELPLGPLTRSQLLAGTSLRLAVPGGREREELHDADGTRVGALVRSRRDLSAEVSFSAVADGELLRVRMVLANATEGRPDADRDAAIARSMIGTHAVLAAHHARFVSLLEPPDEASEAAGRCHNERCWPVLASDTDELLLVSPIILYDHPAVAEQSAGALFDSTEIDEILTLRVMTLTDQEKAEARATDPHAAAIIDRCEQMSAEDLQRLHGVLRNPHAFDTAPAGDALSVDSDWEIPTWSDTGGKPWWDPAVDEAVSPQTDSVLVAGVALSKGSRVLVRPSRRADAQDLFFAGRAATVAAVYADVDGNQHVAVVLTDDPAADLHEWYGRYLYFAPDELEPLSDSAQPPKLTERREEV